MSFCVISDGSCDLDPGYAAQRGIQVVPFYLSFDQKTYLREGQDIAVRDFYQRLVEDPTLFPTTSMPSTADYMDVFLPHARAGEDVLCICITTKFSGSYNSAMTAAAAVAEEYPGVRIRVLDANKNEIEIPELDPEDMMGSDAPTREDEQEPATDEPVIDDDDAADDVIDTDFSHEDFSLGGDDEELDDFNVDDLDLDPLE